MQDPKTLRWVRRGMFAALLVAGWTMIIIVNRMHVTAPVVVICLAYFAAVTTAFMLFRLGASAVTTSTEDVSPLAWGAPIGTRGELEREKRMLLKAIKESEFDHEMGKLSKADADQMIAVYRKRAIEIIKQLDADGAGHSAREQIEAEVRARMALDAAKPPSKATTKKQKSWAKVAAASKAAASAAKVEPSAVKADVPKPVAAAQDKSMKTAKAKAALLAKADAEVAKAEAAAAAARAEAAAAKAALLDDEDDDSDDDDDAVAPGPRVAEIHLDSTDAGDAAPSGKREEAAS